MSRIPKPVHAVIGAGATVVGSVVGRARQVIPFPARSSESTTESKDHETPKDPHAGAPARVDTAATPEVVEKVEDAVAEVSPEVLDHDDLPVPDYDHMTIGSLRARLRSLTVEQLAQIRAYEKAHADRLPVVTMLDNRIAKVSAGEATPTGNVSTEPAPEQHDTARGGSKVQYVTRGPQQNPPSQGNPTNPAQPRSSGKGSTQW